jgi:hypothetical protein
MKKTNLTRLGLILLLLAFGVIAFGLAGCGILPIK